MNTHALGILEFPKLVGHVAGYAVSRPGADAVRSLAPRSDREWIVAEHARVQAMRSLIASEIGWSCEPVPAIQEALGRLRIEGLSWTAEELLLGAQLLRSSRRTRIALRDPRRPPVTLALLQQFADALIDREAQELSIDRAIADDATVRDEASPTLRKVRRELRETEGQLVRLLEREMARLATHHQASDLSVTMRNGRWVMPVRREARAVVGGIVHDSSGTGATIFVEPPAAVEFGNRVRELEIDEQREVERVLRSLTDELRPYHDAIQAAWHSLVALDSLYARARYAIAAQCAPVGFSPPADGLRIVEGRHPLLLAAGVSVVPFDLTLAPDERTLLVSGPNTGGKTVLLKAVGLVCAMAQAGIPVPVAESSQLAVFDDVYADVGDEQSIEASLSTFSAHLKNLGEILDGATASSLVLIDELGSGTDPAEGAALGGAIVETLTERGTLTLVSTHLGQLKLLASEVKGVVNASLQFDSVQLAPTYRLLKGVPGRSYGLSIAKRLNISESVIARAEERLPKGERDMAVLLADLEAREAALGESERQLALGQEKLRARIATVADRELKARRRERDAERNARKEARQYLLEARGSVERAILEVRRERDRSNSQDFEDSARAARRSIEEAAAHQDSLMQEVDRKSQRDLARSDARRETSGQSGSVAEAPKSHATGKYKPEDTALGVGDSVSVGTLEGKTGRVVALRGTEARVLVGSLALSVPIKSLVRLAGPPKAAERVSLQGDLPEIDPVREVDLRGLRPDEIDDRVLQALDAAIRNDLRSLRIIHGKGTGALRSRVAELLKKDTRVAGFRLGAWNEGGAGVTIADI